jgi:hypothetical protein
MRRECPAPLPLAAIIVDGDVLEAARDEKLRGHD